MTILKYPHLSIREGRTRAQPSALMWAYALSYTTAYRAFSISVVISRLGQWNVSGTLVQRWLNLHLSSEHPPTLCFAGRMGVERKLIQIYDVSLRSFTRFTFGTQRSPVGVRDLLCRKPAEPMLYDVHVLSVTVCLVCVFVKRAKSVVGDLLCCGTAVLAAHAFQWSRLVSR